MLEKYWFHNMLWIGPSWPKEYGCDVFWKMFLSIFATNEPQWKFLWYIGLVSKLQALEKRFFRTFGKESPMNSCQSTCASPSNECSPVQTFFLGKFLFHKLNAKIVSLGKASVASLF